MAGTLYVVSTPIGNLSDLTPRAAETLGKVGFVAAEDTRVTLKLLNHLGIKKSLISYNQHNAQARGTPILDRIEAGEDCALCSDAGTPAISDPGQLLVTGAHARGLRVVPIPAASAAITALSVSGLPTGRFVFEGFISQAKRQRTARLQALKNDERTLIIYEAVHKLPQSLEDFSAAFGPQRRVTICRELTKLHEEITLTTLGEAALYYKTHTPKGEFVLVVQGAAPQTGPSGTLAQAVKMALDLKRTEGFSASAAARQAAAETGQSKSAIYKAVLEE